MGKLNNDEGFKHVHYNVTNVAKTFARVRQEQAKRKAEQEVSAKATTIEQELKVRVLHK